MVLSSRARTPKTFFLGQSRGKHRCSAQLRFLYFGSADYTIFLSPFFVQPVFRENGYFMMVSQFQEPSHFLMAYLEDYQMDPAGAQPLLTFSVFDDFSEDKDLTLVRADVLNRGIEDDEGLKVVQNMLDGYIRDDEYLSIDGFNNKPDTFDLDAFISRQKEKWQSEEQIDSN